MIKVYTCITFIILLSYFLFGSNGYPQNGSNKLTGPSTYVTNNFLHKIEHTNVAGPSSYSFNSDLFSDTSIACPSTTSQVKLQNQSASKFKRSIDSEITEKLNDDQGIVFENINKTFMSPIIDGKNETVYVKSYATLTNKDWITIKDMIKHATDAYDYIKVNNFEKDLANSAIAQLLDKLRVLNLNKENDIIVTDKNVNYKYILRGEKSESGDLYRLNSRVDDYKALKEKFMKTELPFDDQNFFVKPIELYNKYMPFMVSFKTNLVLNNLYKKMKAKYIGQFTPAGYSKMCTQNDDCVLGTDRIDIKKKRIHWFTFLDIQSPADKLALYILGNREYHFNNYYHIISKNRKEYAENSNKEFEKHFFSEGIRHDESVKQTKEKVINKFIEDSKFSMASVDHYDKILDAYTVSLILNTIHDDISVTQYKETCETYVTFRFHNVFHMLPTLRIGNLKTAVFAKVKAAYYNNRGIYKVEYDVINENYVYDKSQNLPELIYTADVIDTNIDTKIKQNIEGGLVSVQSFSEEFRNTPFYQKFVQKPLRAGNLSKFVQEFFNSSYKPRKHFFIENIRYIK